VSKPNQDTSEHRFDRVANASKFRGREAVQPRPNGQGIEILEEKRAEVLANEQAAYLSMIGRIAQSNAPGDRGRLPI
jgi:hypothetical protein